MIVYSKYKSQPSSTYQWKTLLPYLSGSPYLLCKYALAHYYIYIEFWKVDIHRLFKSSFKNL